MVQNSKASIEMNRFLLGKVYRVRSTVAILYFSSGLLMCAAATGVFILQTRTFSKVYINATFYVLTVGLAIFSMLRAKTCRLTLSQDELFFYNGLLDVKHIAIRNIERIEYNPHVCIRVYMRSRGKRTIMHRIPNVFSSHDTAQFLKHLLVCGGVDVQHIERPDRKFVS